MKPRITRRWVLVMAVVATMIVVVAWLGHRANESVADMYACADLASLIVHHLRQHRQWPRDWADLRNTSDLMRQKRMVTGGAAPFVSIDTLQARCDFNRYVDWNRLLEDASKNENLEVQIVWARKGNRFTNAAGFGNRYLVAWLRMLDDPNGDPLMPKPTP